MIKLYDYELSADCYQVRLLLGFLALPFERIELDVYPGGEHHSAWFSTLNPLGRVPVIDDDGYVLPDAQAILAYLAARYDPSGAWWPRADAALAGHIALWLGFAHDLAATAGKARLHDTQFHEADIDGCRSGAQTLLRVLDEHLWFAEAEGRAWLCAGSHPTIADIACFPDVMLCEEGGISRLPYPAVRRWTDRVKRIPRFCLMSGVFGASPPREPPAAKASEMAMPASVEPAKI